MTGRALVAYATRHGSTAEIAELIGGVLREVGVEAEVLAACDVRDIGSYDAVIVGSAVYMNRWLGDGLDFLKRFERELMAVPVWLFSSGPTGGTPEADAKVAGLLAAQPSPSGDAGRRAQRIGVRGHATFGGRTGVEMTGLLERWMPRGDWRDFDAIRAWARGVATAITMAEPATTDTLHGITQAEEGRR